MANEGKGLESDLVPTPAEREAMRIASSRPQAPKRFYARAEAVPAAAGFAILLDGKPVKTPGRQSLVAPSAALAETVAAEWAGQGDFIDPGSMPLTRLLNSALDGVAAQMAEVEEDVVKYAGSDLVCYRAGEPEGLVRAQGEAWDPLICLMREKYGARLALGEGVAFVAQPPAALDAIRGAVRVFVADGAGAHVKLAALHAMTTLTGSCVIALAVADRHIGVERGWAAAHVDEDFQLAQWGPDAEAQARRERRFAEMRAAALAAKA